MFSLLAFSVFLATQVGAQDTSIVTVSNGLNLTAAVPDVLPPFQVRFPFEVAFGNATSPIPVSVGENLTQDQTATMPNFAILSNNTQIIGKPYLIAIVDPDAPSPPNRTIAQFLHFLGKDYISNELTNNTLFILSNTSAAITEFVPPTPPNGSIAHRYVVACYLQNQTGVTLPSGFNSTNRTNFNLTSFVDQVPGLTLLSATVFYVAPGSNGTTGPGNVANATSGVSTAGAPSSSNTSPAGGSGGSSGTGVGLANAPAIWSVMGIMLGAGIYVLGL